MRPKGKLFALFAVFAAIGLVTATGAFTTVQAERTAEVNVAGDEAALLAISPDNTAYAQNNSGQTEINLNGEFDGDVDGQGVNINATTTIDSVITITNQGSQAVGVHIEPNGPNANAISFVNSTDANDVSTQNITGSANTKTLSPGQTATISVKIETDSSFGSNDEIISSITIVANADNA